MIDIYNLNFDMDNILSFLPPKSDDQYLMWKYEDREDLYEKYTQYVEKTESKTDVKSLKPLERIERIESSNIDIRNIISPTDLQQKTKQNPEKTEQKDIPRDLVKKGGKRANVATPLSIVSKITDNAEINNDYMRSKLIEFISKKEFHKFFGVKKTADVMKGLSENKWNKSLALFISFMFDVSFIYLKKNVKYNVEKEYDQEFTI